MKKIKMKVKDVDELVLLNEIMTKYQSLNFDFHSGSVELDGKSLVALLSNAKQEFDLFIVGDHHISDKFLKELNDAKLNYKDFLTNL